MFVNSSHRIMPHERAFKSVQGKVNLNQGKKGDSIKISKHQ